MTIIGDPHYVVLVGDVGAGKSTLVEKLTGVKGRSLAGSECFTRSSETFCVPNGSLIISDTPGSNVKKDRLESNVCTAQAFNFRPVSKVFIVVKAEVRMDSVIDNVRKFADCFLELPMELVGVIVTHMDTVEWTESSFSSAVSEDIGIDTVVYSAPSTSGNKILSDILATCGKKHELKVDSENFLKLFKIHNHNRKILETTSDEVTRFRAIKRAFDIERLAYGNKDQVDLAFEFQAYMADEITRAQKRMSEKNSFTFSGEKAANEAGHIANMTNQLRVVLFDIRKECLKYQSDQNASELRKCPHRGQVWAKVEGCDGQTTCGKPAQGCGKSITWSAMAKAVVPQEFSEATKISTNDIKVLPPEASNFQGHLSNMINSKEHRVKLIINLNSCIIVLS